MVDEINHLKELEELVDAVESGIAIRDPNHLNESRYMDVPAIGEPLAKAEQMIYGPGDYGLTESQVEPYGIRLNDSLRKYDLAPFQGEVI